MSIVGGLVGTENTKLAAETRIAAGEWAERNAWAVILGGSLLFWAALASLLVLG